MSQMVKDFDWRRPGTFLPVAMAASFKPRAFFAQMDNRGDIASPLVFLLVVHVTTWVGGLLGAALLQGVPSDLNIGFLSQNLLRILIFAAFFYTIGHHVMRSSYPFSGFLRIFAYASGIWILATLMPFLPLSISMPLGAILALYVLFLLFMGLREAAGLSVPLAAGVLMLSVVGVLILMSLIGGLTVTAPSQEPAGLSAPGVGAGK